MIKYIATLLNISRYLYIKAFDLPKLGQPRRNKSMSKKKYWDSILWATLSTVRMTNPFKQKGGAKAPNYDNNCQLSIFFYIVTKIQKCLRTRNSIRIFNFVGNLRTDSDVLFKNSGNPDYRKVRGFGKIVVHNSREELWKGLSSIAGQQLLRKELIKTKLEEIGIQSKNFTETGEKIQGLSDFLKIPEFLEECYYKTKLKKNLWTTKFSKGKVNKIWFEKISKKISKESIIFNSVEKKTTFEFQAKKHSAEILFAESKIIRKALEQLLEAVFEKIFDTVSLLDFKPAKTRYMALNQVRMQMGLSRWFIEGNILEYHNNVNYGVLMLKLEKFINDQLFIDIIYRILKYKHLENINGSSNPEIDLTQEKDINLALFNVCLYDLDLKILKILKVFDKKSKLNCIKTTKIPNSKWNQKLDQVRYVRYNSNFLIGISGSKNDCTKIKNKILELLQNYFKSALTLQKVKIVHASTNGAFFLGYNIRTLNLGKNKAKNLQKIITKKSATDLVSIPIMNVPIKEVVKKLTSLGYCRNSGNPTRCGRLIHKPLHEIIKEYLIFESKLFNYYGMASNYKQLAQKIHYTLKYSCALTFASKLKLKTLRKVFKKFGKNLTVSFGKEEKNQIFYSKISYKKFTNRKLK
uniref:hypothetical protein n=1 Tax=Grateloupia elliptica TaxID=118371 RepID=UPI0020295AA7|nr:hypothetical protein NDB12_mgp07 [Grateloupia elliptica]UQJ72558.1 hypothetical protein [Grateloupia elliptica]UYI31677.1 hypothetical protein [Grateloupia elliptica]